MAIAKSEQQIDLRVTIAANRPDVSPSTFATLIIENGRPGV